MLPRCFILVSQDLGGTATTPPRGSRKKSTPLTQRWCRLSRIQKHLLHYELSILSEAGGRIHWCCVGFPHFTGNDESFYYKVRSSKPFRVVSSFHFHPWLKVYILVQPGRSKVSCTQGWSHHVFLRFDVMTRLIEPPPMDGW